MSVAAIWGFTRACLKSCGTTLSSDPSGRLSGQQVAVDQHTECARVLLPSLESRRLEQLQGQGHRTQPFPLLAGQLVIFNKIWLWTRKPLAYRESTFMNLSETIVYSVLKYIYTTRMLTII